MENELPEFPVNPQNTFNAWWCKDCGVNIKTAGGFVATGDAGEPKRCESSTHPGKSI